MHVPDGFLDAPTSVATGAVAVVAVGVALRGARRELDDKTAPLAGLVATFVFATQMLNFPVGAGTSGHLLGGALAAVLVGPSTALLCITVVLLVQALLFAVGGTAATGTLTKPAIAAAGPTDARRLGSTLRAATNTSHPTPTPIRAISVMLVPIAVTPPSAMNSAWTSSTTLTHSTAVHGPTRTAASAPPRRWPLVPAATGKFII